MPVEKLRARAASASASAFEFLRMNFYQRDIARIVVPATLYEVHFFVRRRRDLS
jgi:hypothetical protein